MANDLTPTTDQQVTTRPDQTSPVPLPPGLQPDTALQDFSGWDKLAVKQNEPTPPGWKNLVSPDGTLAMLTPNGSHSGEVPLHKVQAARDSGYHIATPMKAPDQQTGWVPWHRVGEALDSGFQHLADSNAMRRLQELFGPGPLKQTQIGRELIQEISSTITDPTKRSQFLVGLVQPGELGGGEAMGEAAEALGKKPQTPISPETKVPRTIDVQPVAPNVYGAEASAEGKTFLSKAANAFNQEQGRSPINPTHVAEDPRSSQIADAYKAATHAPNDPTVKSSYDALKSDVDKQWDFATDKLGIKVDTSTTNPYGLNEKIPAHEELHNDVLNNKHLTVWTGGEPPADHPLSEIDPKTGLTYNTKFRAVHDIFGHSAEKTDFSPAGEETAWNLHRQMFSPEARPALATETRGQAAYTYKYGDFPPQKAALLPEEFHFRPEDLKGPIIAATPSGEAMHVPPRNTKGLSANTVKAIEAGGGIPGGLQKGAPEEDIPDYAIFHDPKSGSSLMLPMDQVTPKNVIAHLEISRAQYAAAAAKNTAPAPTPEQNKPLRGTESYHPDLQEFVRQTNSLVDDPSRITKQAAFITPDGRFSYVRPGEQHAGPIRKAMANEWDPSVLDPRIDFINQTGAIRTRFGTGREGETLHISVPKTGVTDEQITAMRQSVGQLGRNANLVLETADNPSLVKTATKEFVRPSDVEPMLREIRAHPESNDESKNLLMEERQSPLKEPYTAQITDSTGTHIETIPDFSSKAAINTAWKKFPNASTVYVKPFPENVAPSTEYSIPTGKPLAMSKSLRSEQDTIHHELGHAMIGEKEGIIQNGMIRHTHPNASSSTRAAIIWDGPSLMYGDRVRPDKAPSLVRTFMGGIAQDEILGYSREENHNFQLGRKGSDGYEALHILLDAGEPMDRAVEILHQAIDENKKYLTQPAVADIIKENAPFRESNLSRQYHFSPNRIRNMHAEAQRRMNVEPTEAGAEPNNQTTNGENIPGRAADVAGGKGEAAAGSGQGIPAQKEITTKDLTAPGQSHWGDTADLLASRPDGGAIDPKTGSEDAKGFGAEVLPEERQRIDHQPTAVDLQGYYEQHKDVFDKHPELRIGWYQDPEKGWELNIGASTQSREGAEWVGRKLDQKAIYDIEKGQVIDTGGQNQRTTFGRYPLEQRLEDLSGRGFKEMQTAYPTQPEMRSMIRAGQVAKSWWQNSRDAMSLLTNSDPEAAHDLGQFLTAVSSNKGNDLALRLGLKIYTDWIEAGKPNAPGAISDIAEKAQQALRESDEGMSLFGSLLSPEKAQSMMPVDKMMLERYVGGQSFYHPEDLRAAKIANMGLTMGGDPWAGVLDRHTGRTMAYGEELQPTAKSYFAMKEWLRKASQAEDMTLEEGQAANWVVGRLLSPDLSLTDKQILAKIKSGNTLKEGETYANIILNDPKVNRLAREVIAKFGGTPDEVFADLRKITEQGKSRLLEGSKKEASNPTLKSYLGRAVKGRDAGK